MSKGQSIDNLNKIPSIEFQNIFRNVVENYPQAAIEVSSRRPFVDTNQLVEHFNNYLTNLDHASKVKVLQLHPDLAGKLASDGELTAESAEEQAGAGLNRISNEQYKQLNQMNEKYKEKFGFPFVICVRETNKIEAILRGITVRLQNERNDELDTGIDEVKKICRLRIGQIIDLQ
ncbi:2-oxo-4-hydroxy-4-carboxy-5-ureidoimidazoline decarboxylase-like [Bradysia coprophila]|uniref:2-oxo-4-hydroxy-4-carboxy-5-ureidoimidazoline decarboxylase-like n=1 Tax=Bradysia coprophila TaxID=38358 RepID=UPI00187D7312|nr:2-oxo-4-hydroxy-4-carboxy-5-ureidoimidazoline decarboxylase-like [Bradysia coprophila]